MFDFNVEFARNGAVFTIDLFRQLAASGLKQNIIFSPFSVQSCVALAFAGAEGITADEIVDGLRLVSSLPAEVGMTFQNVLEKYKDSKLLKIANKIYVHNSCKLKADYKTMAIEQFHAGAEPLNFAHSVAAAQTINKWVNEKTEGKIDQLVSADSFNDVTRLVLLNAMHFKGDWQKKFDVAHTEEDDFWISEQESVKVPYMNQKAKFNYAYFEELGCTALEMPYKDSDLSMIALLPEEREGLKTLAEKLAGINLVDLADRMSNEEVMVKFPKFKIEFSAELSEPLKKLGIKKMFDEDAEFNNMLDSPMNVYVSKILHKACIEVNEEGSEAAAATGMIMMTRMALLPTQFVADRPFFYAIWNKKNILFAGAFVNAS